MNDLARAEQRALAPGGAGGEHLSFLLGTELFAIGILNVKEIIEYTRPDTVPMMPDYLRGVINLRGTAVPVMDLSVRFGRGASSVTRRSCIIVVELDETPHAGGPALIGVMADAVNAVLDIAQADIVAPPDTGASTDFLHGMGKVGAEGRFVLLLNVKRIFSRAELGTALAAARVMP